MAHEATPIVFPAPVGPDTTVTHLADAHVQELVQGCPRQGPGRDEGNTRSGTGLRIELGRGKRKAHDTLSPSVGRTTPNDHLSG